MSELHEAHTIAKLVGSPPGYIGHDDPDGWMTTQIRRNPRCLLLLDEVDRPIHASGIDSSRSSMLDDSQTLGVLRLTFAMSSSS